MSNVPHPYEVNGKLVKKNGSLTLNDAGWGGRVQNGPLDTNKACIPKIFNKTSQIFFW